jgi:hypothetical protein
VFNHQHAVAQVAQLTQRVEQARRIAWVQPDARLIQHVERTAQPGADLRRQADALRLAASKGRRGAVKREIPQPDFVQKPQPGADVAQHRRRNLAFTQGQSISGRDQVAGVRCVAAGESLFDVGDQFSGPRPCFCHRERRYLSDCRAGDSDGEQFGAQPRAVACRAGAWSHKLLNLCAFGFIGAFCQTTAQSGDNPLEWRLNHALFAAYVVTERHHITVRTVEQRSDHLRAQIAHWCVQ